MIFNGGQVGQIARAAIMITVAVCVTALTAEGTIDGATFVALLGPIIGVAAGGAIATRQADHVIDKVTTPGGGRKLDPPAEGGGNGKQ